MKMMGDCHVVAFLQKIRSRGGGGGGSLDGYIGSNLADRPWLPRDAEGFIKGRFEEGAFFG